MGIAITYEKKVQRSSFDLEYDAAIDRDMKAYEINLLGNYYKINLLEDLQVNLFIKSLSEEYFNSLYYTI